MTTFANLWPLFVIAGFAFVVFVIVRLARRFSPGAISAGPKVPPDARNFGQSDTAEDLRTIEQRLDIRPESLINRIERSCIELGIPTKDIGFAPTADDHINVLLGRLETHLGLDARSVASQQPHWDNEGQPHGSH